MNCQRNLIKRNKDFMIAALSQLALAILFLFCLIKWVVFFRIKSRSNSAFFWHDRVELRHTDSAKDKTWKLRSNTLSILIAGLGICTLFIFLFKALIHH